MQERVRDAPLSMIMMKRRGGGGRVFSRMGAVVAVLVVSFGPSVELSVRETSLSQCGIPEDSLGVAIVAGADMCRLTRLCRAKPWYKPCQWQETTCLYQGGSCVRRGPGNIPQRQPPMTDDGLSRPVGCIPRREHARPTRLFLTSMQAEPISTSPPPPATPP